MGKNLLRIEAIEKNKTLIKVWYELYYNRLYVNGCGQFRVSNRVEDAISDTFLKLLKNKAEVKYEEIEKPWNYLWTVFYRSYLDLLRKGKRFQARNLPLDDKVYQIPSKSCISESMMDVFMRNFMPIFSKKLNSNQQTCFLLFIEGYSYKEIAEKTELTLHKVNYAIRTAKDLIRDLSTDQIF